MQDQYLQLYHEENQVYTGPYYHPDDFSMDRVTYLALSHTIRQVMLTRRNCDRIWEEFRRGILMGYPVHMIARHEQPLQMALYEWDLAITTLKREQSRAHAVIIDRSLLDLLLHVLHCGHTRYRAGTLIPRNLSNIFSLSLEN